MFVYWFIFKKKSIQNQSIYSIESVWWFLVYFECHNLGPNFNWCASINRRFFSLFKWILLAWNSPKTTHAKFLYFNVCNWNCLLCILNCIRFGLLMKLQNELKSLQADCNLWSLPKLFKCCCMNQQQQNERIHTLASIPFRQKWRERRRSKKRSKNAMV